MQLLDKADSCRTFRALNGTEMRHDAIQFNFEKQLQKSIVLSKLILRICNNTEDTFLWFTEFGIWPSLEDTYLFHRLRGSDQPVWAFPGQTFALSEYDALVSHLHLMLAFGWGGWLLAAARHTRIYVSHDSWLAIDTPESRASVAAAFASFGLQPLVRRHSLEHRVPAF